MSQENVDKTKKVYQAFAKGDVPNVLADFAENVEWHSPAAEIGTGGIHRGPQAIISEVFMALPQYWDDFAVIPNEFVDAGNRVFVLGKYGGKGKATGKAMDAPFVHTVEFRDGKVVRIEEFTDTAANNALIQ